MKRMFISVIVKMIYNVLVLIKITFIIKGCNKKYIYISERSSYGINIKVCQALIDGVYGLASYLYVGKANQNRIGQCACMCTFLSMS